MLPELEVIAHPTGYWLVKAGETVFAVPPLLGRALETDTIPYNVSPADWARLKETLVNARSGQGGSEGRLPPAIWLRLPLLPAALVRTLARWLAPLASKRGLLWLALMGLAGYTHLGLTTMADPIAATPLLVTTALGLFFVTAIWHELGHAAALTQQGYPPGGVGAGLLFVIPVLYADVTAVGALGKSGKLQVDGAGVAFQLGLGGLLATTSALGWSGEAGALAAWLALLAVMWSLFPFIKADGYWMVCDALGLPELESDAEPPPDRRLRWFLRVYRLANAAFLAVVAVALPVRLAGLVVALLDRLPFIWQRSEIMTPLLIVGVGVLGTIWFNIARRLVKLVRAAI